MSAATQPISPLRQRMIDDMRMRKLAPKTQTHYLRAVRQFAGFLGRSPDTASVEDLRRYQLYLVDQGTSPVSLNAAITGLKFFFEITVDHGTNKEASKSFGWIGVRYAGDFIPYPLSRAAGKIKCRGDIVEGLENASYAFIGLMEGKSFG